MHTLLALCHHLNGCSWVSSPAFFNSLSSTLTRAMLQLVLFSWFCHCFSGLKTWTDPFCGGLACDPTPLGWEFPYGGLGVDSSSSIPRCGDWSGCYYPIAGELLSGRWPSLELPLHGFLSQWRGWVYWATDDCLTLDPFQSCTNAPWFVIIKLKPFFKF